MSKVRVEKRSIRSIVGERIHNQILDVVEGVDPFDQQTVQTFLNTPVCSSCYNTYLRI